VNRPVGRKLSTNTGSVLLGNSRGRCRRHPTARGGQESLVDSQSREKRSSRARASKPGREGEGGSPGGQDAAGGMLKRRQGGLGKGPGKSGEKSNIISSNNIPRKKKRHTTGPGRWTKVTKTNNRGNVYVCKVRARMIEWKKKKNRHGDRQNSPPCKQQTVKMKMKVRLPKVEVQMDKKREASTKKIRVWDL